MNECKVCGRAINVCPACCEGGDDAADADCYRFGYERAKAQLAAAEGREKAMREALLDALVQAPHSHLCAMRVGEDEESCDCWRKLAAKALNPRHPESDNDR